MRLGLTGGSSFLAYWLAAEFAAEGWEVFALGGRAADAYRGVAGARVSALSARGQFRGGVRAEDGSMEAWVRRWRPDLWIHHHHPMEGFRSSTYDAAVVDRQALDPLEGLVRALREVGCRGLVLSATYQEPGEGGAKASGAGPYGMSKARVGRALHELCLQHRLPFSKVVLPNPVGPLENEDRLVPRLLLASRAGERFVVHSRSHRVDQVPVLHLVSVYLRLATALCEQGASGAARPSGWVGDVGTWVEIVCRELLERRLALSPPEIEWHEGTPGGGGENPPEERAPVGWDEVWDHYARVLRSDPFCVGRYLS